METFVTETRKLVWDAYRMEYTPTPCRETHTQTAQAIFVALLRRQGLLFGMTFRTPVVILLFQLARVEEMALRKPMLIQMMGNTLGGGIHCGRRFSALAFSCLFTLGRRAFNSAKVLERKPGRGQQPEGQPHLMHE